MRIKITAKQFAGMPSPTFTARKATRCPAAAPREADIQRAIIAFLESRGAVVIRANSGLLPRADGGRMRCLSCSSGSVSDVLACFQGRFLAVEVKRPGKVPSEGQAAFLAAVERSGGIGVVATGIEDAAAVLETINDKGAKA
ncbi:MAG TPA: VRR-NUC domain-containing protein [Urbifossiella sp.]